LRDVGPNPAFISIHSFTPVLNGISREVQAGVLWDKDSRLSDIFIEQFRASGLVTGDNEPYSGKAPQDFTIDHHAEEIGLPHVGIEIRQDLIDDIAGIEKISPLMHEIIDTIPERIGLSASKISA
jgi:predicted N-formylglutamate amidohydrolase